MEQMNLFNSNDRVTVYSQVSRKLYNEILNCDVLYPIPGVSCNACTDKAENYLIDRIGFPFFFGWENLDDVEKFKGRLFYTNDINSKYVLVKIRTNKDNIIRTNYYCYSDVLFMTEAFNEEFINSKRFEEECNIQLGSRKTIKKLIDDVFIVDEDNLVQVLIKYLDKREITKIANLSDIRV